MGILGSRSRASKVSPFTNTNMAVSRPFIGDLMESEIIEGIDRVRIMLVVPSQYDSSSFLQFFVSRNLKTLQFYTDPPDLHAHSPSTAYPIFKFISKLNLLFQALLNKTHWSNAHLWKNSSFIWLKFKFKSFCFSS